VLSTRAHHSSTYEFKPDFVCVILVFGFYHPNKPAIFLVDWCGRLAIHQCPHYQCWISSTCDYRPYRLFTFLIVGFCRVKPQLDGDIFKISSLKDFSLRSIILRLFDDWNLWIYNANQTTLGSFWGCNWALDCTRNFGCLLLAHTSNSERVYIWTLLLYKTRLVEKGLFYQSNLPTHLFPGRNFWFFSKCVLQPHTPTHRKEIPWENAKKPGNNQCWTFSNADPVLYPVLFQVLTMRTNWHF